jgi:hypothetical protein
VDINLASLKPWCLGRNAIAPDEPSVTWQRCCLTLLMMRTPQAPHGGSQKVTQPATVRRHQTSKTCSLLFGSVVIDGNGGFVWTKSRDCSLISLGLYQELVTIVEICHQHLIDLWVRDRTGWNQCAAWLWILGDCADLYRPLGTCFETGLCKLQPLTKQAHSLLLQIKLYLNTTMPIRFCIVCGCYLHDTQLECSFNRDHIAWKA